VGRPIDSVCIGTRQNTVGVMTRKPGGSYQGRTRAAHLSQTSAVRGLQRTSICHHAFKSQQIGNLWPDLVGGAEQGDEFGRRGHEDRRPIRPRRASGDAKTRSTWAGFCSGGHGRPYAALAVPARTRTFTGTGGQSVAGPNMKPRPTHRVVFDSVRPPTAALAGHT
jgi:hypothetical protein